MDKTILSDRLRKVAMMWGGIQSSSHAPNATGKAFKEGFGRSQSMNPGQSIGAHVMQTGGEMKGVKTKTTIDVQRSLGSHKSPEFKSLGSGIK